jgi:4-amino-4-deoxy-L-arabinose transferase-like glycosyltransferase
LSWSQLKSYSGLVVVLLAYLAIAVFTSFRIPLSAGPDEVAHFMFARFLEKEGYLPLTPEDRALAGYKSDQPPLNAALVAAAFWGDLTAPPYVKMTHNMPRRHLAISVDHIPNWLILNTEDPWTGEILLWRVGRLLSILFSGATLIVIYFLALLLFDKWPTRHQAATATVMSVAFIPSFVFISGVFSYENLLGLWLSLFLLTAVYLVKKTGPVWLYLAAGLFVGLAIVTKLSALVAPLSLVGLVLVVTCRAGRPLKNGLVRLALSLLGLLLGAGWWFVYIKHELNQIRELGWVAGLLYPFLIADGSDQTSVQVAYILSGGKIGELVNVPNQISLRDWIERIFRSFWQLHWQFDNLIFLLLVGLTAIVLIGLGQIWWHERSARIWLGLLTLHIAVFFILPLVRFVVIQVTSTAQGQHILFPAVGAFAILITWGLSAWFPARGSWPWLGGGLLGLGMLGWSVVQAIQIYQPPLPVRTVPPRLPDTAVAQELDFGALALAGYDLNGLLNDTVCCEADVPALGVSLYWLAQEYATENYLTEVSLVDSQGTTQSMWLGYPADGRYLTKAWDPGDTVRDDIWLPLTGVNPGVYMVKLRLLAPQGPVMIDDKSDFVLSQVEVASTGLPAAAVETGEQPAFNVWQHGRDAPGLPTFETRSTIQISANPDLALSLVGPNQVTWSPERTAGQTYVFIVDPRWPRGAYRLRVEADGQAAWESDPILFANGEGRKTNIPYSQFVVNANFANQLMLLGYNLPQRRALPGESFSLTLNWQALRSMPADFIMFTRLRDQQGQVWGGYDRKAREVYSTLLWIPNEVVEDSFTLPIRPDTPAGLYTIDVGYYLPVGQAAVSLPLVQAGQMSDQTSVTLGPFKVGKLSADFILDSAHPQHVLNQSFGNNSSLTLLGYDLRDAAGHPVSKLKSLTTDLHLKLYWRSESSLPIDYTTFVHVRNMAGDIIAQKDQLPLSGAYPASLWEPGEIIADEITIPSPTAPVTGTYQLVIGMYDLQTGERLVVPGNPANEVVLTTGVEMP